jgi:hypothetical protein
LASAVQHAAPSAMTDNIVRREAQRRDDPFGIPACFYWTIDEVADWVESIGYSKYKVGTNVDFSGALIRCNEAAFM